MAKDKLKIMLSFMRELNDNNIPCAADYDITADEFGDIIEMCQDAGYIKNAKVIRGGQGNKVCGLWLDTVKLTVSGLEYLHNNSALLKTYKGMKFIQDWLPW